MGPRVNGVPADNVGGVPRPAGDERVAWARVHSAARERPDGPPPSRL